MNRKGANGAVAILLIGMVVLIGIALYAFATYSSSAESEGKTFNDLTREVDFAQDYVIADASLISKQAVICDNLGSICNQDLKERIIQLSSSKDIGYPGSGNFFGKVRNGDFSVQDGTEYTITFSDLFVSVERAPVDKDRVANKIIRNFDLIIRIDKQGKVVGKEIRPVKK